MFIHLKCAFVLVICCCCFASVVDGDLIPVTHSVRSGTAWPMNIILIVISIFRVEQNVATSLRVASNRETLLFVVPCYFLSYFNVAVMTSTHMLSLVTVMITAIVAFIQSGTLT